MVQFQNGGNFFSVEDFAGKYDGEYDGRSVKLDISATSPADGSYIQLNFTFTDRNIEYRGQVSIPESARETTFCLNNLSLSNASHGSLSWPKLMLHTNNKDLLSGYSEWNGNSYGMFFCTWGRIYSAFIPRITNGIPFLPSGKESFSLLLPNYGHGAKWLRTLILNVAPINWC